MYLFLQVQLVLKQGNLEVPLTGHVKDFVNTTLLPKNDIDEVNAEIKVNNTPKKMSLLYSSKRRLLQIKTPQRFEMREIFEVLFDTTQTVCSNRM